MYDKLVCRIRDKQEIEKHYSGRYGAPGMEREPRKKKTPEDMARQNCWRKRRELRRVIELNFGEGDWHVTLTCAPEKRPDREQAPDVIRRFIKKLRKAYRKNGWQLKYIVTCETGKRGAVHWHMIVNNMHTSGTGAMDSTAGMIRRMWTRGRAYFVPLDGTGDYGVLADYIVKETAERMKKGETMEKLSYMSSRNLIRPVVRREKRQAKSWRKNPAVPDGWYLVPGTLVNGTNKYTGLPYQHYTIRKYPETRKKQNGSRKGEEDADGGHLHRHKH